MKRISLLFLIIISWPACRTWAQQPTGLQFEMEIEARGAAGLERDRTVYFWWDNRWREESEAGFLIIDLAGNMIWLADHENKVKTGGPLEAFLQEMETAVAVYTKKVQEYYGLPRENPSRKREEPAPVAGVRLEELGKEPLEGKPVQHLRICQEQEVLQELWIDEQIQPGRYFSLERLLNVLDRFQTASAHFERKLKGQAEERREAAIQQILLQLFSRGLEIRSRQYENTRLKYEKRLTGIQSREGKPSLFLPPDEYRLVPYSQYLDLLMEDYEGKGKPVDDEKKK